MIRPTLERLQEFGRMLSRAIPVQHDTPTDLLKLLERLG